MMHKGPPPPLLSWNGAIKKQGLGGAGRDDSNKLLQHQSLRLQVRSKQPSGFLLWPSNKDRFHVPCFIRIKSKHTHNTEVLILHFF